MVEKRSEHCIELENAKDEIVSLTAEKGEAQEEMDRLQDEKERLHACLKIEREAVMALGPSNAFQLGKVEGGSKRLQAQIYQLQIETYDLVRRLSTAEGRSKCVKSMKQGLAIDLVEEKLEASLQLVQFEIEVEKECASVKTRNA